MSWDYPSNGWLGILGIEVQNYIEGIRSGKTLRYV